MTARQNGQREGDVARPRHESTALDSPATKDTRTAAHRAPLAYVDQARGIAILLVLLVHANQHVTGLSPIAHAIATFGQSGVQLFFVASAFTLCLSASRARGDESFGTFFAKRFFRIAPMYYVGVLLYGVANTIVAAHDPSQAPAAEAYTWANVVANLTFVHGFVPSANNSIVPGGWSIGTEMAFYACFPLLFALHRRMRSHGLIWLGWPLLIAVCVNICVQVVLHRRFGLDIDNNSFAFYHLLNQLPVFLCGIVYFFLVEDRRRPSLAAPLHALGMATIAGLAAATALWLSPLTLAFALVPLALGLTFAGLLALMRRLDPRVGWLAAVGRLSYSIYVVHFVVTWATMDLVNRVMGERTSPELRWLTGFVLIGAISVAVARVTERLIEAPGIAFGRRIIERWQRAAKRDRRVTSAAGTVATPASRA